MSVAGLVQITRCKRCGATLKRAQVRISFNYRAGGWRAWGHLCRRCSRDVLRTASAQMEAVW